MIQVSSQSLAIDNRMAVSQTIKVGARRAIIQAVGLFRRDSRTGIFHDPCAFANWRGGEYANGMNS